MLNIAYLAVAAQCTLIAAAGYAMYGAGALDVITFNLPRGLLATLCASLILVNPVAKFALTVDTPAVAAVAAIARATPGALWPSRGSDEVTTVHVSVCAGGHAVRIADPGQPGSPIHANLAMAAITGLGGLPLPYACSLFPVLGIIPLYAEDNLRGVLLGIRLPLVLKHVRVSCCWACCKLTLDTSTNVHETVGARASARIRWRCAQLLG